MNKKILAVVFLLVATMAFAADKYISSTGDVVIKTVVSKKVNLQDTVYATQDGKVGIGATPASKLEVTTGASTSATMGIRFNTSNPRMGFGVAASNGFPYMSMNTNPKLGSDNTTYDINGPATQFRMISGGFDFLTAPSGTAGGDVTFTNRLNINSAGIISMPSQPSFAAWRSSASGNLTSGSTYKLAEGGTLTEQWDNTASLDNSSGSGVFTVPATGHYMFNANVTAYCTSGYVANCSLYFNDNGTYRSIDTKHQTAGTSMPIGGSLALDMTAMQSISVYINCNCSAAAAWNIQGGARDISVFSGYMIP